MASATIEATSASKPFKKDDSYRARDSFRVPRRAHEVGHRQRRISVKDVMAVLDTDEACDFGKE